MSRHVITIPEVPKSVNRKGGGVGTHWGQAHREKKRWEQLYIEELAYGAKVPKHMDYCAVEITVRWKRRNHRDLENFRHPIVKPLADALQIGGWLVDDTDKFFGVRSLIFEYPAVWPYTDPRVNAELVIVLDARYPPNLPKAHKPRPNRASRITDGESVKRGKDRN